ncbi:sugar ABC transporter permease [Treponema zuelzerae]|uniref:Sugar ABC transporter permease n=1 Tax=Teretinema zuelzerae TaxID=156 RepID=A0AAE3JI06_9SPIR|nr:sugar ABC transporter permease [Teretinema zuelzerae]MCD1653683.1 sugar ABC transporter permease [Teretinema zuelzerae]
MKKNALTQYSWYLYLIPALLFYTIFMALPLLDSIRMSLYTGGSGERSFVGFDNYLRLFLDPDTSERFWGAFGNTWYFFFINMICQNFLALIFALMLTERNMKGSRFYQTVIFIPVTLAILVTGYLWKLILNPQWGAVALILGKLGLEDLVKPWLGDARYALTAVALVSSWQWVGIPTMMFFAGLQNISEELIEAAEIDGASKIQKIAAIRLPLIKPVIGMVAVLTFVNNFNAFDVVFAMENANGAPQYSTDLIGTLFYRVGIAGQHPVGIPDPGLGAAIATSTFIMLMIGVVGILRLTKTEN